MSSVVKKEKQNRFEYKYLLTPDKYEKVFSILNKLLIPDINNIADKPYVIRSLYFDSPNLDFYYDRLYGNNKRNKVRIRFYGDNESSRKYIEIKGKSNDRNNKLRAQISESNFESLVDSDFDLTVINDNLDSEFKNLLRFLYYNNSLIPVAVIRYLRYSLYSSDGFKISFDSEVRASLPEALYDNDLPFSPIGGNVIMELKFDSLMPDYINDIIRTFSLERKSITKYGSSIYKLYQLTNGPEL